MLAIKLIDLVKDFRTALTLLFSSRKKLNAGPKGDCLEEFIFQAYLCAHRWRSRWFGLRAIVCNYIQKCITGLQDWANDLSGGLSVGISDGLVPG